jgi:hypothetical protein
MSYIVVRNKGEIPLWGIRLLGLSDKKDEQIGQFGTGLKETLALLARFDRLPVIYSGLNRIDFSIQTIEGQAEICFRQSQGTERFPATVWHGLGIHPNYGMKDWIDPWMALREIICNAQDAGELYHDVCSVDPSGTEGCTQVFIPLNAQILAAYSQVEQRLLFLKPRETIQQVGGSGRAMRKGAEEKLQIYHKGVWIQEAKKTSLLDYELYEIKLNESRSCDWWSVEWEMSKIVGEYTLEQCTQVLRLMLVDHCEDFYEAGLFSRAADYADLGENNWFKAFVAVYGDNAVVTTTDAHFYERLKHSGYVPVVVSHEGLHKLLLKSGCKHAVGTLSQQEQEFLNVRTPTQATQKVFDLVWDGLQTMSLTGDKQKPAIMLFKQRPEEQDLRLGSYDHGVCYVNEAIVGSEQEWMACLEEIGHHVTGAYDFSRQLQTYLVTVACRSMCRG